MHRLPQIVEGTSFKPPAKGSKLRKAKKVSRSPQFNSLLDLPLVFHNQDSEDCGMCVCLFFTFSTRK